ncbi:hypothetical protein [Veillonella magna]|uniref:YqaJ viral recombinase domain-containing protein n=1 Tax=Veillonella magna TaxID=464322 RepID=A0ABS2GCS8_9FIRM|nr:hypothetical protein [Veillonella magna]MBM6823595.1 hypothetical protein [Veillonella magna]MBM6911939.1 hypothetical protein [Veillonella magna]
MSEKHYDEHGDKHYEKLLCLFTVAEARFSLLDWELIEQGLAERTLCGALMNRLNEIICFDGQAYNLRQGTVADVEYNRFWNPKTGEHERKLLPNQDCRTCEMTDKNCEECQKRIFTDIIVHKRKSACNEIAIEAKKSELGNDETEDINSDRKRLINLTTYKLGYKYKMGILCIFHPWDPERKRFRITHEFYKNGRLFAKERMTYWVKNKGRVVESMKEDVN